MKFLSSDGAVLTPPSLAGPFPSFPFCSFSLFLFFLGQESPADFLRPAVSCGPSKYPFCCICSKEIVWVFGFSRFLGERHMFFYCCPLTSFFCLVSAARTL